MANVAATQEEVAAAFATLNEAIVGLVEKPVTPPGEDGKPGTDDKPGTDNN